VWHGTAANARDNAGLIDALLGLQAEEQTQVESP